MSQEESEKRMSFFEHLDELRVRVMRCLYVFVVGFIGGYFASEKVMEWLRAPLFAALPEEARKLYFTSLFENFLTHLKISGYISVFVLSPFFFFQIWGFISPGLREAEKKLVVPFISAATFFFVSGALFAYYVLFPVGFKYFVTYGGPADVPLLTIDSYYSTALKLMLLFGLGFELPVFIVLLGVLGVVDAPMLRAHRRTAIIGITIASALFAPPDAMSMLILMAPLILLYEGSILVVQAMGRKRSVPSVEPVEKDPLKGKSDY
jgi:sec-independent protein translocase protein TatC